MKRRNVEGSAGKLRRVAKRSKISDGYSAIFSIKFLLVWAIVITLDFVADFRFELLYPFYVFFSNVSEIFQFKGIYYLLSYISITFAIDMICYYLIPLHWLFFASTTYVWLQFTWYSERGISLVSILIWVFLICVEALIRLRELKNLPLQFELCRPLAAHGIGYPIFTLGIGCKSYVHYRLRLHTKRIVAKENEFYYSLLQKALGPEYADLNPTARSGDPHSMLDYTTNGQLVTTSSNKYLNNNFNSNSAHSTNPHHQLSAITGPELGSNLAKNQTISTNMMMSNGTSTMSRGAPPTSSNSLLLSRSQAAGDSSTGDSAASNTRETLRDQLPPFQPHQSVARSVIWSLCSLVLLEAVRVQSCIFRYFAVSINSIHCLTSKVLPPYLKTVKASSTSSLSSSSNTISQTTAQAAAANHSQSVTPGGGISSSSSRQRRGSLNDTLTQGDTVEQLSNGTVSTSTPLNAALKGRTQYLNGSANRGKSLDSNESLKKSSSSRMLDSSKSSLTELHKSPSFNESSSSLTDSVSSSSESICKKSSNISPNQATVTDSKTSSPNGKYKEATATSNGTCVTLNNNNLVGNRSSAKLSNDSNNLTVSNNHLDANSSSVSAKNTNRRHKRGSIEDPGSLLEIVKSKEDHIWKLEGDNQRLKAQLQTIRQCESDLRQQLASYEGSEKVLKGTVTGLQTDIEHLHKKLQTSQQSKQQDKQSIQRLEKALEDEKKRFKTSADMQAASEKKARMAEETAARASAMAEAVRNVCSESCRLRQRDTELEIARLRKELVAKDEQLRLKEMILDEYKDLKDKGNMLMSALTSMRDKNSQLDETLNMERLIKIDLCNHFEKTKLQLRNQRLISMEQENEIRELKRKLSLYGMPNSLGGVMNSTGLSLNGFGSSSVASSSSNDNVDLVNRCFSSCSPSNGSNNNHNANHNSAASPSSLSSGTPPLSGGGQGQSLVLDPLCSVPSVAVSSSANSAFNLLPPMRDYSLDQCMNGGGSVWPSSLNHSIVSSVSSVPCTQSDLLLVNTSLSQQTATTNGGSADSHQQQTNNDFVPTSVANSFAFNTRFDM